MEYPVYCIFISLSDQGWRSKSRIACRVNSVRTGVTGGEPCDQGIMQSMNSLESLS